MAGRHYAGMPSFGELRKQARAAYDRIGDTSCPVLDAEIAFRREGFFHLVTAHKVRSRSDQVRRFRGIPHIRDILASPRLVIEYREKQAGKRLLRYWTLRKSCDARYKVVVRQVGSGKKHFLSVFPV